MSQTGADVWLIGFRYHACLPWLVLTVVQCFLDTQFPVVLSLGNVSSTLADNLWDNIASHRHFTPFVNTEIWHNVVINSEGRHYYQYFPSSIKSSSIRPWRLGADRLPWCRDISLSIECRVKNMYHTPRIVQCIPYWRSLSIQIH